MLCLGHPQAANQTLLWTESLSTVRVDEPQPVDGQTATGDGPIHHPSQGRPDGSYPTG